MSKHLQRDIDSLNTELLNISSMVEDMIDKATLALAERRYDLADEVVKSDEYVDAHEVHARLFDPVPRSQRSDLVVLHEQAGTEHVEGITIVGIAGQPALAQVTHVRVASDRVRRAY